MSHGPLAFLGVFLAVAASWFGVVVGPYFQFGDQQLVTIDDPGIEYPLARSGIAAQGAEVYRANGCQYCHTQQVRPPSEAADLARKWGPRRTVSRDYLRDQPPFLGRVRLGPDLANIGARETNSTTLMAKLFCARMQMPGSTMPRYPYLFELRRVGNEGPPKDAVAIPPAFSHLVPAGHVPVPKAEAYQLVAYLQSLKSDMLYYEVFPPQPPKRATNAAPVTAVAPDAAATNQATATPAPAAK